MAERAGNALDLRSSILKKSPFHPFALSPFPPFGIAGLHPTDTSPRRRNDARLSPKHPRLMIKKILVALDADSDTPVATRYAADIARRYAAEVTGLAVVDM